MKWTINSLPPSLPHLVCVLWLKFHLRPRLVNFFMSICTVDGRAVKANQEMVLRLTWIFPEKRQKLFLELVPMERTASDDTFGPVRQPSGAMTTGKLGSKKHHPADYIGRDAYEHPKGFAPIFVKWQGSPQWEQDMDELFWDAKSLGIKYTETAAGGVLVRVERLCWVLNGPLLCEAVTGVPWEVYRLQRDRGEGTEEKARFQRQHQLASYFVGQLQLHCAM